MKCGYRIVLQRVVQTIERYGMFCPRQRAGVAVSGGADSVCLLEVLRELAPRWQLSDTSGPINARLAGSMRTRRGADRLIQKE